MRKNEFELFALQYQALRNKISELKREEAKMREALLKALGDNTEYSGSKVHIEIKNVQQKRINAEKVVQDCTKKDLQALAQQGAITIARNAFVNFAHQRKRDIDKYVVVHTIRKLYVKPIFETEKA